MRIQGEVIIACLTLTCAIGCGGNPSEGPNDRLLPNGVGLPILQAISPTNVTAGQKMTLIGQGFCEPTRCRTRVVFEGSFLGSNGSSPVQLQVEPEYVNQGTVSWTFGPNIPFAAQPEMGTFSGTIRAVNVPMDGQPGVPSEPLSTQIHVGPSIIIRQMGPLTGACPPGITDTVENTGMMLQLEAIGVNPGTVGAPLLFSYTFLKENFTFEGRFGDQFQSDPEALFPAQGPVTLVEKVQSGSVSTVGGNPIGQIAVLRQPVTAAGSGTNSGSALFDYLLQQIPFVDAQNRFSLTDIKTTPLPQPDLDSYQATILVVAVDSAGNVAKREIPLRVWTPIEVSYDGNADPVQAFAPVPVSGCIPGTTPPATLTYNEQTAETRMRRFETIGVLKPGVGLEQILTGKVEAEFGLKLHEEVSSSQLKGLELSAQVLPGEFGVIYRQTIQLERVAALRQHGACGESSQLGQVVVTDWRWSPELAKATTATCPPFPPSKLHASP